MRVTPEMARAWLKLNICNRPLVDSTWYPYAIDMLEGRWLENGEPLIFDSDGKLVDGQNRLTACVEADTSFRTLVVYGVKPQVRPTIDIGKKRTVADALTMDKQTRGRLLESAGRIVWTHKIYGFAASPRKAVFTQPQLKALIEKDRRFVEMVTQHSCPRFIPPRISAACRYLFGETNEILAGQFFADLTTGADLTSGNPVRFLRDQLLVNSKDRLRKMRPAHMLALFFKTWNYYRNGKSMKCLKIPATEEFPIIGGERSIAPPQFARKLNGKKSTKIA